MQNTQIKDLKIGQEITLISKGIIHMQYSPNYIDKSILGRCTFLKITKLGTKYIYGTAIYYEPDGRREERSWEYKYDTTEYLIFPTIRLDLKQQKQKYDNETEKYNKHYDQQMNEIESKYNNLKWKEKNQWREQNPPPKQTMEDYQ